MKPRFSEVAQQAAGAVILEVGETKELQATEQGGETQTEPGTL